MSLYEVERKWNERLAKLYDGGLEVCLSLKTKPTNKKIQDISGIFAKGKIENYKISRTILHPTKDIQPQQHEERIYIVLFATPFQIEEIIKQLEKISEVEIYRIKNGLFLALREDEGSRFLIDEKEP